MDFVNLHAHSLSIGDSIGFPGEHIDFAIENGLSAHAFTDHGTMSALSYAFLHQKKLKEKGKSFKIIHGVEAYFVPSLELWDIQYQANKLLKKQKKSEVEDEESSVVIEDEEETKSADLSGNDEFNPNRRAHIVLLAQNAIGLKNIFKMVSLSYQKGNFYRFPRIDMKMLKQYNEGVIISTACLGSSLTSFTGFFDESKTEGQVFDKQLGLINNFKAIFGDRFFLELQWNAIPIQMKFNQQLIELAEKTNTKLISTADCHYPRPELWKEREIYKAIARMQKGGKEVHIPQSMEELKYQIYPKNGDQMFEDFHKYSSLFPEYQFNEQLVIDSIERTHDIAFNKVEDYSIDTSVKLPSFVVPEGKQEDSLLEEMAFEGLKKRNRQDSKEYVERLEEELDVIKSRKFSKYFLTMKAISDEAQAQQLCGVGRGSSLGSLLSYCLKITNLDPIKWGLQFSRFLRKDDKGWPDIDFDGSDPMELKQHLINKWGNDSVIPISNYNTLQLRSLVKDLSKFYNVPFYEVNDITNKMFEEATPEAKKFHEITAGVYVPTYEECLQYSPSFKAFCEKYPDVSNSVKNLQGSLKSISRHAGGLLVSDHISENMPLISSGGVIQSPWAEGQNVRHLEPLGFIKFDILGLASLRMIEGCIKRILIKNGVIDPTFEQIKQWYEEHLSEENINLDDQNIYKNVFQGGKFIGVFQFTEKGAQDFCRQANPKSLIDISNVTSIFRPGPLSISADKKYIEAVENPELVEYDHPLLKECLESSFGLCIYQEQISLLAHKIGNDISIDEGNGLRKLLTKKGTGSHTEELEKIKQKFYSGAIEKGFSEKQFNKLWDSLMFFASYGFNRSHSSGYGYISFQCAYLLTYHEEEWIPAFLDKETELDDKKADAINLVKSYGYKVATPDINKSDGFSWICEGKTVYPPLIAIKGLGEAAIRQIIDNRPFNKIEDLLFNPNVPAAKVNKRSIDVLCRTNALQLLKDDRFKNDCHFWAAICQDRPKTQKKLDEYIEAYDEASDFSKEDRINNSLELLGIYPIEEAVGEQMAKRLARASCLSLNSVYSLEDEYEGTCWFIPVSYEEKFTKNFKRYLIMKAVDSSGKILDVKVWQTLPDEEPMLNRGYMANVKKDSWGLSMKRPTEWVLI